MAKMTPQCVYSRPVKPFVVQSLEATAQSFVDYARLVDDELSRLTKRVEDLETLVRELRAYHDDTLPEERCSFCGNHMRTNSIEHHDETCPWHWILGASDG